jgi:hypothetical protein
VHNFVRQKIVWAKWKHSDARAQADSGNALIFMVGISRCDVPARSAAKGGTKAASCVYFSSVRFRRLTLRPATGTVQRAVPTK